MGPDGIEQKGIAVNLLGHSHSGLIGAIQRQAETLMHVSNLYGSPQGEELAQMLVDGGAVGVTCAKITQAAALVAAGIKDVLIANEIVGPIKVANLVELSKSCDRLTVAVDNADNLRAISAEAVTQDAQMSVLVDLNIGMNRCGIHWSKQNEIVMMAQLATDLPNIEFMGLMCALPHPQT